MTDDLEFKEGSQFLVVKHIGNHCFTLDIYNGKDAKQIVLNEIQAKTLMIYLKEKLR